MEIDSLKFDSNGLIPAIVQDAVTKEVLTLAYMNRESLEITLTEGKTCFYSRSRQALWRKGETSGNYQHVVKIISDCDQDALVVLVHKDGPACHLGTESCFQTTVYEAEHLDMDTDNNPFVLDDLYRLLDERNLQRPKDSYTTYLFEKGKEKILKKIGEESCEVVIAAMKNSKEELIYEISDLCYHVLVLMVSQGLSLPDIQKELSSRHVIDKKEKQETMR